MARIRPLLITTALLVIVSWSRHAYRSAVLEPQFLVYGQTSINVSNIPIPDPQTAAIIRGKTINARTGTPIENIQIIVAAIGASKVAGYALSDSTGSYEIRVPPGLYTLAALRDGFLRTSYSDAAGLYQLALAARQEAAVDFRLIPGAAIAGRVTDINGAPIADANVFAMVRRYRQGKTESSPPAATARTNERGEYQLINLPAGRYYFQAGLNGVAGKNIRTFVPRFYRGVSRIEDAQPMRVTAGERKTGIDFRLRDATPHGISGRITFLASGEPVAKMTIRVDPLFPEFGMRASTETRADGTFRLEGQTAGNYRMEGRLIGDGERSPSGYFLKFFAMPAADIPNMIIHISDGTTVRGTLRAAGGTLPENMRVQGFFRNPLGGTGYAISDAIAGANGTFEIRFVQPGVYDLDIRTDPASGGRAHEFFVDAITVGGKDVSANGIRVPEGTTPVDVSVTVDFRPGTISGKTIDSENKPLLGAGVLLMSADPKKRLLPPYWKQIQSDRDGAFRFGSLTPGDYLLIVWPGGSGLSPEAFAILEKHAVHVSVERSTVVRQDLKLTKEVRDLLVALSP